MFVRVLRVLESDLASTMYWIDYPLPFLRFYYNTFPAVDDGLAGAAEVASLARAGRNGFNDSASDGCASSGTVPHTDVHPEFPPLRTKCGHLPVLQCHL